MPANSTTKIQQALIQQIENLGANMLLSLEKDNTINKDDYDTLLNLISTLEDNCEDVTPIMQSMKKLAYQGKIPAWTQQNHDMPALEKLTNTDIDYLFSYASELVTQLNPEQQEVILIDIKYQLEDQLRKINPDLLAAYQKGLAEGLKVLTKDKKHDTKIGDKAVDLILGYTEILRKVINEQRLIDYLTTLQTEILELIKNEPLETSQKTLPNSLLEAQSQQDLSTRNTGLDSSSMSMNTTPTSPIAPSSARSSSSAELTATPQPISDSSIKHASKSPLASTLFTTIQAPKLFEPEETKLEQQTASTLKNLLSDSDTAKSHYHEKAPPIPQIRTSSTPSKTVRPLSPVTRTTKEEKQQANNLQKTGLKLFQEREIEREEKERTTKMQAQLKQQSEQMQAQLTKSKQALETHEKEVREQISQHYQEIAQILYSTLQQDLTKQQQSNHTNQQKVLEQEAISSKITEQESMVTELKKLNIVAIKLKEIAAQRTLMFEKNEQKVTHLFEESKKALEAQKAKELEQQIKLLAQQLSEGQRQLEKDENEDRNIILEYAKKLKIIAEQLTQTTQKETQLRNALEQEILSAQKQLHYTRNASIAQIQANLLAQQALIQQAEEEKLKIAQSEHSEREGITTSAEHITTKSSQPQLRGPTTQNNRSRKISQLLTLLPPTNNAQLTSAGKPLTNSSGAIHEPQTVIQKLIDAKNLAIAEKQIAESTLRTLKANPKQLNAMLQKAKIKKAQEEYDKTVKALQDINIQIQQQEIRQRNTTKPR